MEIVLKVINISYEKCFLKHKTRLCKKFEKIQKKEKPPAKTPTRPSLVKNPVLQLQSDPLPPEAVAVLSLGTKFAIAPKEVPKMDIIEEVEKSCLSLERKGKRKEADQNPRQASGPPKAR